MTKTINWDQRPFWPQVMDFTHEDFRRLSREDRLALTQWICLEFRENFRPHDQNSYRAYLAVERIAQELFTINAEEVYRGQDDEKKLKDFTSYINSHDNLEQVREVWPDLTFEEKEEFLEQVKNEFAFSMGLDFSGVAVKFTNTGMLNGDVSFRGDKIKLSQYENTANGFLSSFHALMVGCARKYHQMIIRQEVPMTDERAHLFVLLSADLSLQDSMHWDVNQVSHYFQQTSLREALKIADVAYGDVATAVGFNAEKIRTRKKNVRQEIESRFLSQKVYHSATLGWGGSEDVSHALDFMTDEQIDMLNMRAQAALTQLVYRIHGAGDPIPERLSAAVERILTRLPLTSEYADYQVLKCHEMYSGVCESETITRARQNWTFMNKEKRLDVLQEIADMHGEVHGYEPCLVTTFEPEPGKQNANGYYKWGGGALYINGSYLLTGDFKKVSDTVVHEATHALQDHIGSAFLDQEIGIHEPLFRQAEVFMMGRNVYITYEINYDHYRKNPLEKDAFEQGEFAGDFIAGSDADRKFYMGKLKEAMRARKLDADQATASAPASEIS